MTSQVSIPCCLQATCRLYPSLVGRLMTLQTLTHTCNFTQLINSLLSTHAVCTTVRSCLAPLLLLLLREPHLTPLLTIPPYPHMERRLQCLIFCLHETLAKWSVLQPQGSQTRRQRLSCVTPGSNLDRKQMKLPPSQFTIRFQICISGKFG